MRAALRMGAALAVALTASAATAQENGLGAFFKHLFGAPPLSAAQPAEATPTPRPSASATRRPRRKPTSTFARDAAPPAASATPPPTASQFVYVLGDSLAIAAADGMAADLQNQSQIGVIDRARDSSGLVREDYFDWPRVVRDLVTPREPSKDAKSPPPEKQKVDFVVVMLGINDMQSLKDGDDYVDPLTERWSAIYARRIQSVVAPLRAAHVPVLWVGLPPMRADKFNTQTIALNQLFKDNSEAAGAKYIDIVDAFADQSGGFDAFGPNLEGQRVKLRGADGIHLTAAGGLKLAHFLDAEVLASLKPDQALKTDFATLPPDANKPADDLNEQIRREMGHPGAVSPGPAPLAVKPEFGSVASLAARPASAGAILASEKSASDGEAERRLRRGDPPPAAPGRADDFSR